MKKPSNAVAPTKSQQGTQSGTIKPTLMPSSRTQPKQSGYTGSKGTPKKGY